MIKQTILPNGVRVVTHSMRERTSASVGVWFAVGGRFEDDHTKGAAHFLEHIVFRGSHKYSCDDIKRKIEGVGGALNAFTAEEQTCYYAKVPAKYLNLTTDILIDMAVAPSIAKRDVERERGIILEEIKMYRDLPQYQVMEQLEQMMWPNHPLGENLAGTIQSVSAMSQQDLKTFHANKYTADNMVVVACGAVSHDQFVRQVKKVLSAVGSKKKPVCVGYTSPTQFDQIKIETRPIEQIHMALGFPGLNAFDDDIYALTIFNTLLGGNMSSWLFDEVREKKGLAYSISSSSRALSDTGMFYVRAGVDKDKCTQALAMIIKIIKGLKRRRITDQEFQSAKEYYLGQYQLVLEDTMDNMLWLGETVTVKNRLPDMAKTRKKLSQVTLAQMRAVALKVLDLKQIRASFVGPITATQARTLKMIIN